MKKENSLKINTGYSGKKTFFELLPGAATVFAASAGFSAMLFAAVSAEIPPVFGIALGIFAAAAVLLSEKKFGRYIPAPVSAICLLAVLIIPALRNGLLLMGNNVFEKLVFETGRIYPEFEIAGRTFAKGTAFLLAGCVCLFLSTAVSSGNAAPAAAVLIIVAAGAFCGILSTDFWFLLFFAGAVGTVICVFAPEKGAKTTAKSAASALLMPVLCGVLGFVLITAIPAETGGIIKTFFEKMAHSILYDSAANAMPEGDFEDLGAFEKSDEPALEITAKNPQKLYLKGFVGEIYNGKGWESLENESLGEYAEEFYVLHEEGFFAQTAVSDALKAVSETEETVLSIKNLSACLERAYLPYALSDAVLSEDCIGDANTKSFGKSYSVGYIPGGLAEWYLAQVKLSEEQGENDAADEHLAKEYVYREFVRENYLALPEEAFEAIDRIFGDSEADTATEIISGILLYFDESITYDEDFSSNGEGDFVSFFLEKSARGYSVHYATAATLMLRYFGIPARYAEGYFLSAEEAAGYESGETIILTENHAHAWAEYYLEGVGWVPFEVTPGYMDDELEKAAFSTNGESSKHYEQSELPESNVEQDRPKDDITEAEKDYSAVLFAAAGTVFAALAAFLAYVIVMRRKLEKALSEISSADNRSGAAKRFGYAAKLLENADISGEEAAALGFEEAAKVNREALFSSHEITDEQRKTVDDYAGKVLAECKKKWNIRKKIKYKLIKVIY